MYKGTITTDSLNVRISRPYTYSPCLPEPLWKGQEIEIISALYGQEIDGENLWYRLSSGYFVWSGYVFTEEYIPIETKNVIFTADDYGVVDSIDDGIIDAIKKGLLNSVTCFTNYGEGGIKSLERIRKLETFVQSHSIEMGVHLTITSGSPILGRDKVNLLCRNKIDCPSGYPESDFFDYTKIRGHYRRLKSGQQNEFLKQLEDELDKQLSVFLNPPDNGNPIKIHHITSHHNSLLFMPEFFEVMLKLCNKHGVKIGTRNIPIPIRSLHNLPGWKDNGYYTVKGKIAFPKKNINVLKSILKKPENILVKTPDLLHSDHFGPPPFILKRNIKKLVKNKMDKSDCMLDDLIYSESKNMEFLLHLRKGKVYHSHDDYEKRETLPTGYAGINPKSFDARTAEHKSFVTRFSEFSSLPEEISRGNWKQIQMTNFD